MYLCVSSLNILMYNPSHTITGTGIWLKMMCIIPSKPDFSRSGEWARKTRIDIAKLTLMCHKQDFSFYSRLINTFKFILLYCHFILTCKLGQVLSFGLIVGLWGWGWFCLVLRVVVLRVWFCTFLLVFLLLPGTSPILDCNPWIFIGNVLLAIVVCWRSCCSALTPPSGVLPSSRLDLSRCCSAVLGCSVHGLVRLAGSGCPGWKWLECTFRTVFFWEVGGERWGRTVLEPHHLCLTPNAFFMTHWK